MFRTIWSSSKAIDFDTYSRWLLELDQPALRQSQNVAHQNNLVLNDWAQVIESIPRTTQELGLQVSYNYNERVDAASWTQWEENLLALPGSGRIPSMGLLAIRFQGHYKEDKILLFHKEMKNRCCEVGIKYERALLCDRQL